MDNSGRYWIRDWKTGRRFCIEPISNRNQKSDDVVFTNGGIDGTEIKKGFAKGGSVLQEDSIITEENGFKNIVEFTGSDDDAIRRILELAEDGEIIPESVLLVSKTGKITLEDVKWAVNNVQEIRKDSTSG